MYTYLYKKIVFNH